MTPEQLAADVSARYGVPVMDGAVIKPCPIETVTHNKLVDGNYGDVIVWNGHVANYGVDTQAELDAVIETLIIIRDAKVLK